MESRFTRIVTAGFGIFSPIRSNNLKKIYDQLLEKLGPQNWWPAETPFEVMAGAILTQNTNWANVAKAIDNLKKKGMLTPQTLISKKNILPEVIRPAGYYNIKAKRLLAFARFLIKKYESVENMAKADLAKLRSELCSISGIGHETADSILLYALNKPVFVIDAYTRRIFYRHGLINGEEAYDDLRLDFERNLPKNLKIYQEFHALLVALGKRFCKRDDPLCADCPVSDIRRIS